MSRKPIKTAVVIVLLSVAAYVLGFVRARTHATVPRGRIVLQYWEKWTGKEAEQMKEIVTDFNRTVGAEKGIWVTYMSMTNVDQKTLVATAAGVPPDIAGMWDGQIVQFAEAGAIEPLEDLAREYSITEGYYKKAYWDACNYQGHLYALISTPASIALLYNQRIFEERADDLRKAGLDPSRPPRTIEEMDRYADALDVWTADRRVDKAGYIPMEPGWYIPYQAVWFGGRTWDPVNRKITLLDSKVIESYDWVASYSRKMGQAAMSEFRQGFGNFNSAQNPFLTGDVAMVMQGPWMGNYIENLKPTMNRWRMTKEEERRLPFAERKKNYEWAAAAFPSAVPGVEDACYVSFDTLVIPKGAKHKREAFEFIAYVNRQEVMEKLCSMHSKNSPLANVSKEFVENHPNAFVDVFDRLARSPNAQSVPQCPIWPEVVAELNVVALNVSTLQATAKEALTKAQKRVDEKWETYQRRRTMRAVASTGGESN